VIPGYSTWTAEEWADQYWRKIYRHWESPAVVICDRDPKFISAFWRAIYKKARTHLAMTAAYHPAADGQSERTNQWIEITIYCVLSDQEDKSKWILVVPIFEFAFNHIPQSATRKTPAELLYRVKTRSFFSAMETIP
jgi:hypothetical protein